MLSIDSKKINQICHICICAIIFIINIGIDKTKYTKVYQQPSQVGAPLVLFTLSPAEMFPFAPTNYTDSVLSFHNMTHLG